jgi:hypothetical protein
MLTFPTEACKSAYLVACSEKGKARKGWCGAKERR